MLQTRVMGQKIYHFETIDSTNTYAKEIAYAEEEGTLVIADEQVSGRGSRGRSWDAQSGSGIWMTLILKPDISPSQASRITLVMALSVARACKKYIGIDVQIKWPNDIVYHGKKLCGILTEMNMESEHIHYIVIGVGINVNTEAFPEDIRDRATSLFLETGQRFDRVAFITEILQCFEEDYERFLTNRDLSLLMEQYTAYSVTIGSDVKVLDKKEAYVGKALAIDHKGRLLVRKEDETEVLIVADTVSVRGVYGYV